MPRLKSPVRVRFPAPDPKTPASPGFFVSENSGTTPAIRCRGWLRGPGLEAGSSTADSGLAVGWLERSETQAGPGSRATTPPTHVVNSLPAPKAGWQSGHAADCKSAYLGSIPGPASISFPKSLLYSRAGVLPGSRKPATLRATPDRIGWPDGYSELGQRCIPWRFTLDRIGWSPSTSDARMPVVEIRFPSRS